MRDIVPTNIVGFAAVLSGVLPGRALGSLEGSSKGLSRRLYL
jgi:hypothetical protein